MFFAAVAVSFGHQALFYSSFYVLVGCLWAVLMYGLLEVDAHTFQGVWLVFVLTSVLGGISLADLRHDDSLDQMFDAMLGFALAIFFLTVCLLVCFLLLPTMFALTPSYVSGRSSTSPTTVSSCPRTSSLTPVRTSPRSGCACCTVDRSR